MYPTLQTLLTFTVCFLPGVLFGIAIAAIRHNRSLNTNQRTELRYGIRK
jgi:hypothetical protein